MRHTFFTNEELNRRLPIAAALTRREKPTNEVYIAMAQKQNDAGARTVISRINHA